MKTCMLILFLVLLPFTVLSQEKKAEENTDDEGNLKLEKIDTLMTNKLKVTIYKTGDRRDPFISLMREFTDKKTAKNAPPPGLAGLLVEEIKLEGIMNFKNAYYANFVGPDNKSYLIQKGERLYDGEVIDISMDSVTFRKELTTKVQGKKERIVVIKLNPGDLSSKGGRRK